MYKIVEGSKGSAPRFAITCGLQEGYGPDAKSHLANEVVSLVEAHLKECAASGRPYLTGSVTTGTVVYAWPEGEGKAGGGHEPQATYGGEKNPLYNSSVTDEQVAEFLNGLASVLGSALGQTRVYVAYNGDMWILQREDAATPTGETV
jgi:hypothetical protein